MTDPQSRPGSDSSPGLSSTTDVIDLMCGSHLLRLALVGLVGLLLLAPIGLIGSLIYGRENRRQEAMEEVSSKWGRAQSLTGPALVVPYMHEWTEVAANGQKASRQEMRYACFLPERLSAQGRLETHVRKRGIFEVPVYRLAMTIEGEFILPQPASLGISDEDIQWDKAHLALGVADARAIQEEMTLLWNGQPRPFLPGTGGLDSLGPGIHAPLPGLGSGKETALAFSFELPLQGSQSFTMVPFGQSTTLSLMSNYPHPSFQGQWLPAERTISGQGFSARWSVPFLGRNYPQAWISTDEEMAQRVAASHFGVALFNPVDHYRMSQRSVKYAVLFIGLTFATIWLLEVRTGTRVHPIQYLLVGSALALFFLLELSLSEHMGFPLAYTLASLGVVAMVWAYSGVALGHRIRALVVAAAAAALYAYLYVVLMNEDYALLLGSLGLFAILGMVMFFTRFVDWYAPAMRKARLESQTP